MIKSRKFFKLITMVITMIVSLSLVLTLAACTEGNKDKGKDPTPVDDTVDEIFPNGSFYQTTGSKSPYTPTNWSGTPGSSSGDNATPSSVPKDLIYGVISAHPIAYKNNKSIWDDLENPGIPEGAVDGDGNMLMIYNKVPTAYKFTNNKLSLEMGNYYKISVDVKTIGLEGDKDKGAYIYFSDAAMSSFEKIDTNGEWRTYSFYIESSVVSTKSLSVTLGLGYGNKTDGKLTKGYAFFDNVKAKLLTEENELKEFNDAYAVKDNKDDYIDATSLKFLNGDFTNFTGSDIYKNATNYTTMSGTGKDSVDQAHTTSSYTQRGIVDLIADKDKMLEEKKYTLPDPCNLFDTPAKENKALIIRNTDQIETGTAAGYMTSKFYVPMGKVAKITVYIWTDITNADLGTKDKRGVYIVFSGDTDPFESEAIRTNKEWEKFEFYIDATESSSPFIFSMEMWLGIGGRQSYDYHAKGVASFDNISLQYIDKIPDGVNEKRIMTCPTTENSFKNGNFSNAENNLSGWSHSPVEDVAVAPGDNEVKIFTKAEADLDAYIKTPLAPVIMIKNNVKTAYSLTTDLKKLANDVNKISIEPHKYYKLSMWVKTKDIEKGKGATINLYSKDKEDVKTQLLNFSAVNTLNYNNYSTNGYREYVVYLEGNEIESKEYFLEIKLGDGTTVDPTNFVSGTLYLANVRFTNINYNEYNNVTTNTYVTKKSLTSTSNEIANGNFNKFDMKESKFDDKGNLIEAAVPSNFIKVGGKFNDYDYGIMDIKNDTLREKYGIGTIDEVYNGWNNNPITGHISDGGKPYFLFIKSKERKDPISTEAPQKAVGYKTDSFSLSSSSYYIITVDVKTQVGSSASLYFSTTSGTNEIKFENINTNGKWEQFTFAIEVGLTSTSVELAMYLGATRLVQDATQDGTATTGEAYFDNLLYTKYENLEDFNTAKSKYLDDNSNVKEFFGFESFVTETFDRTTDGTPLSKPYTSNWTGNVAKGETSDAPSGVENQVVGVLKTDTDFADVKTGIYGADDVLIEGSALTDEIRKMIFKNNGNDMVLGNNVLMINNRKSTGYNYKTYSSRTLASGKTYEISVWVKTYLVKGAGAAISLQVDTNTHTYKNIGQDVDEMSEWTKYTFYVFNEKTTSISSVYLTLQLGSYSKTNKEADYSKGYAFFDNMTFKEIDKAIYEAKDKEIKDEIKYEENTNQKVKTATEWSIKYSKDKEIEDNDNNDDADEPTVPDAKVEFPWLLVSSLIIGAILIVAVVVVMIRYFKKKPKVTAAKPDYDRKKRKIGGSTDTEEKKADEYDKYSDND